MPAVKRFLSAFFFSVLAASCALVGTVNADDSAIQDLVNVDVITSEGQFTLQLRPDVAPDTVANFLEYVRSGLLPRHRISPGYSRFHGSRRRI